MSLGSNDKGVVISGGDSSKRHLVSPLSLKLHTYLLILSNFDQQFLVENVLFNIDNKFLIPQFNLLKRVRAPGTFIEREVVVCIDRNKDNKDSRNLNTDLVDTNQKRDYHTFSAVPVGVRSQLLKGGAKRSYSTSNFICIVPRIMRFYSTSGNKVDEFEYNKYLVKNCVHDLSILAYINFKVKILHAQINR